MILIISLLLLFIVFAVGVIILIVKDIYNEFYPAEYGPCSCGRLGRYICHGAFSDLPHYVCDSCSKRALSSFPTYKINNKRIRKGKVCKTVNGIISLKE